MLNVCSAGLFYPQKTLDEHVSFAQAHADTDGGEKMKERLTGLWENALRNPVHIVGNQLSPIE